MKSGHNLAHTIEIQAVDNGFSIRGTVSALLATGQTYVYVWLLPTIDKPWQDLDLSACIMVFKLIQQFKVTRSICLQ